MRIWSLHPKYLDTKGLLALWRETLLAKHVLEGKTKGYKNHPQLDRFKKSSKSLEAINLYLSIIHLEAAKRQFNFDITKFKKPTTTIRLYVNDGQLKYEFDHLLRKLRVRDVKLYDKIRRIKIIEPHPLFVIVEGKIETWEIVK